VDKFTFTNECMVDNNITITPLKAREGDWLGQRQNFSGNELK